VKPTLLKSVARVFEGRLYVHYGQAYIETGDRISSGLEASFVGQNNGLCGAASPGSLLLLTGLHTGRVNFTLDIFDSSPPIDHFWEEIVEVSFTVEREEVRLFDWNGECVCDIPLPLGTYRVRYCVHNMTGGGRADTVLEEEESVDSYSLAFWSANLSPDTILKQTSKTAAYWHRWVRGLRG
jgi:hypothetical protein